MKKETKEKLSNMKTDDVYSLVLFALFQLKDVPEYSSLSELAYVLDKNSLFNFLELFGGTTIKVPTLEEFKTVIESLMLYQYINLEGIEPNQAMKLLNTTEVSLKEIKDCYSNLVTILNKFEFGKPAQEC